MAYTLAWKEKLRVNHEIGEPVSVQGSDETHIYIEHRLYSGKRSPTNQRLLGIYYELGRRVDVGRNRGWPSHKKRSVLVGPRDEVQLTSLGDRWVI